MSHAIKSFIPPQDTEAEMAILGAMLTNDAALEIGVAELSSDYFYEPRHQTIFKAITFLRNKNSAIDTLTVKHWLENEKLLNNAGGFAYLSELSTFLPVAINTESYARIVKSKAALRSCIKICRTGIEKASSTHSAETLITEIEGQIYNLAHRELMETGKMISIGKGIQKAIGLIEHPHKGIKIGLEKLDRLTGGFARGDLIIVAARPSVGKTALALNWIHNAAKTGAAVQLFSLEMSIEQICNRLVCAEAQLDTNESWQGNLDSDQFTYYKQIAEKLRQQKISIYDRAYCSVSDITALARRQQRTGRLDMIVIDYLQLMRPIKSKENRNVEVAEMSRGLKIMARELNVPVIALSQLSRNIEQRSNQKPVLSDLRDSGAIEQDADLVLFLSKAKQEEGEENTDEKFINIELSLQKQRNGPIGDINLVFQKSCTRFSSVENRP